MVEITKVINRYKYLSIIINALIKSSFFFIRKIFKAFTYNEGNIVVLSLHKLGDTVFTIPAILALQDFYQKKIIIFCYPEAVSIYKLGLQNIDFCEVEHKDFYFNNRVANHRARKLFRSLKPEIIFDITGVMTSATLIFNSRAKEIIGTNREQFRTIYDYYVSIRHSPHLMDKYLDIANLKIPCIDREQAKTFNKNINRNGKILIHPFAGWKAKEWNLMKFIKLAGNLKNNYDICLIAPVNTIDKDILMEIESKGLKFVETQSIDDLIKYIKECSVFVGNDSGPLHIAGLLGKPTFTIYGPTNPDFHVPFGDHHTYCKVEIKCSPVKDEKLCFTDGGIKGCPSFECMNQLSLEKVFNSLESFLYKIDIQKKSENIISKVYQ